MTLLDATPAAGIPQPGAIVDNASPSALRPPQPQPNTQPPLDRPEQPAPGVLGYRLGGDCGRPARDTPAHAVSNPDLRS